MKHSIMKCLVSFVFACSVTLLFQRCGKDDEVLPPPPSNAVDTLSAGWQKVYVDSSTFIIDIAFPTSQIGYICGNRYVGKSIDGGLTWTKINFPDSLNGNFSFIFFKDENTGWVTTLESFILRTTDGGLTWKKTLLDQPADIQFVSPTVGYVATANGLFKSTDGGTSYQKVVAAGSTSCSGVFFFDQNNGWVTDRNGFIQATQDGGSSFNKRTDLRFGTYYNILFIDANYGWVSGVGAGNIWFTKNAGVSWDEIGGNLGVQNDVDFFNSNDGFISTNNEIYRTTNGGTKLTRVLFSAKDKIIETCFTDPNNGWATAGAYIYRYSK